MLTATAFASDRVMPAFLMNFRYPYCTFISLWPPRRSIRLTRIPQGKDGRSAGSVTGYQTACSAAFFVGSRSSSKIGRPLLTEMKFKLQQLLLLDLLEQRMLALGTEEKPLGTGKNLERFRSEIVGAVLRLRFRIN